MGKLENRQGEATRAFNGGKSPQRVKEGKSHSQSNQGRSPGSSKPDFDRATQDERSGLDKPTRKHEAPEHMKQRTQKPDRVLKPKHQMMMRRRSSPGLSR